MGLSRESLSVLSQFKAEHFTIETPPELIAENLIVKTERFRLTEASLSEAQILQAKIQQAKSEKVSCLNHINDWRYISHVMGEEVVVRTAKDARNLNEETIKSLVTIPKFLSLVRLPGNDIAINGIERDVKTMNSTYRPTERALYAPAVDKIQTAVSSYTKLSGNVKDGFYISEYCGSVVGELVYENHRPYEHRLKYFTLDREYKDVIYFSIPSWLDSPSRQQCLKEFAEYYEDFQEFYELYCELPKDVFPIHFADLILQKIMSNQPQLPEPVKDAILNSFEYMDTQKIFLEKLFKTWDVLPKVKCNYCDEGIESMSLSFAGEGYNIIQAACSKTLPGEVKKQTTVFAYCQNCYTYLWYNEENMCTRGKCGCIYHTCSCFPKPGNKREVRTFGRRNCPIIPEEGRSLYR